MAERWAVATGNWSATGTWNGGTLPSSGDDVYANNFTVTIDQSITANSLNIVAGTTAVQGGNFTTAMTGTISLTNLNVGAFTGTLAVGLLNLTGGAVTLTVTNTVTGDTSTTADEPFALRVTGGTHTINASFLAGSGGGIALSVSGGTQIINGNITGGSASNGGQILGGTVTMTGNVVGGTGVSRFGINIAGSGVSLTLTGNVTGGTGGSGNVGISMATSCTVTVTGNVTGGNVSSNYGISVTSSTAIVTGDITGATANGVRVVSGTLTARGNLYASSSNNAISSNNGATSFMRISGDGYMAGGYQPIEGRFMVIQGETFNLHTTDDDGFPSSFTGTAVILTNDTLEPTRFLNVAGVAVPIG